MVEHGKYLMMCDCDIQHVHLGYILTVYVLTYNYVTRNDRFWSLYIKDRDAQKKYDLSTHLQSIFAFILLNEMKKK